MKDLKLMQENRFRGQWSALIFKNMSIDLHISEQTEDVERHMEIPKFKDPTYKM